jgi:hypothetical protein
MRMEWIIIVILFVHFWADFVFQTDWMAQNKSKDATALMLHVVVYTAILAVGTVLFIPKIFYFYSLANGIVHWLVDFFTSRLNSRLYQLPSKHWFFVGVGLDQFIHAACLIASLSLIAHQP